VALANEKLRELDFNSYRVLLKTDSKASENAAHRFVNSTMICIAFISRRKLVELLVQPLTQPGMRSEIDFIYNGDKVCALFY
jgi:hypothetical protein